VTVVGNRPQFVKAAAVSSRLREVHEELIVHTGQHHDDELSRVFFDELGVPAPDHQLNAASGTNTAQTARILSELEPILAATRPELAEELNRVLVDSAADLLLCSTPTAVENLEHESARGEIHLVGDVMADVSLAFQELARERSTAVQDRLLERGDYLLVTAHRAGNVDPPERLARLVELLEALPGRVVFPVHPRTRRRLDETGLYDRLASANGLELAPPLGYLDFLELARSSRAVLTDSGGVQKEAYLLGVPCVTLRDTTEWVETVAAGWNVLVDLDRDAALAALEREPPAERPELYGGGRAAERVRDAVSAYTERL
jgi:UDP-N-acetylglucosamine 2-epimerase (non-hydrolysing)/UDP-GlcNAc3NAcA epimerase